MRKMTYCASKAKKFETSSSGFPSAVMKSNLDTTEHLHEMTHVEYVLVPRQLAAMAIALVLNHDKLLDDGLPPRYLMMCQLLGKPTPLHL